MYNYRICDRLLYNIYREKIASNFIIFFVFYICKKIRCITRTIYTYNISYIFYKQLSILFFFCIAIFVVCQNKTI